MPSRRTTRKAAKQTTTTNSQSVGTRELALSQEAWERIGMWALGRGLSAKPIGEAAAPALVGVSTPGAGVQPQRDARSSTTQVSPKVREPTLGSSGQGSKQEQT